MPKNRWFWAAALWTATIAVLCLVSFRELPSVAIESPDKFVHAIFHFLFVLLWYAYYKSAKKLPELRILGKVLSFSIIYGCLIEIAQGLFTTTRQADLKDVMANSGGALLAVLLLIIVRRLKKTRATE